MTSPTRQTDRPDPPGPTPAPTDPLPRPPLRLPAALIASYLLFQLALLVIGAWPERTQRSVGSMPSWILLAAGQTLFLGWLWPLVRLGQARSPSLDRPTERTRRRRKQATLEAGLLVSASLAPAAPAIWWADASAAQAIAPAVYGLAWLAAGWIVLAWSHPRVQWSYASLMAAFHFGLLAVGYLDEDFLGADPTAWWRYSPMCQAARLAEAGWPVGPDARIWALPAAVLLILTILAILVRPADAPRGA